VANKTATPQKENISVPVPVIIVGLVLVLGLAGFVVLERQSKVTPAAPVLTEEARAYIRAGHLALSEVEMKAHESYLKQSVVEITGKISNKGDRVLKLVEINCVFYDPYGQLVLRERVPIVSQKIGGLAPGETKDFRLAFDNIPESWNQALPQLVIAQIVFAG
jgi:Protein of unknown function (DUF3426)